MTRYRSASAILGLLTMFAGPAVSGQQLPELDSPSTLNGEPTSARFFGGVSSDNGQSFASSFDVSTPLDILASIHIEDAHINTEGNIYTVAQVGDQSLYRDSSGNYLPWDFRLETLGAAYPDKILSATESFTIVDDMPLGGDVAVAVSVWLAYDTNAEPGQLFYSGSPIAFSGTSASGRNPFQELHAQGVGAFLGTIRPNHSELVAPGVTEHFFDKADGPMCFTGLDYSMYTRDGSSNSLLIFLQGGGFCGPTNCETAVESGIPFISLGILNPADPENPVANYDVGYVPYCDGSGMMGNNDVDSNGDGRSDRFFRGIQNLSASLDVIATSYPSPGRIVLAGNSAGGFAVHAALPLVRKLYPGVEIDVINDSGNGILSPGGMDTLIDYWNAGPFFPASCDDCIGEDGNLTGYHNYQLNQDPGVRLAYISSKQDATISANLPGGGPTLEAELIEAATELKGFHPDRFNCLIANGDDHTYLIRRFDSVIGGTTVRQWITDMVTGSEAWVSRSD